MAKAPVNAVVLGAGMIGTVHAEAIRRAGGTLRGVVTAGPARTRELVEEWGLPVAYPDFEAVLADPLVDVVHVCTPNNLHVPQVEAALLAGKHVVCEKPLATAVADAERVVDLAQSRGLVLAVPFVYRYHPLVREIRARRVAGEFGPWQLLHGSYLQDWLLPSTATNWRVDPAVGGPSRAFADIGSHWCDLVEWVAGVRFDELSARFATPVDRPGDGADPLDGTFTEDVAALLLRTTTGVLGTLTVSQVSPGRKNRLWFELDGSHGSAVFDQERPEAIWLGGLAESRVVVRDPSYGSPDQRRLSTLPAGHPQGFADCFAAFVGDVYAAIGGDVRDGLPLGTDGLRSAQIVAAALRSASSLTWAGIPDAAGADRVPAHTLPASPRR